MRLITGTGRFHCNVGNVSADKGKAKVKEVTNALVEYGLERNFVSARGNRFNKSKVGDMIFVYQSGRGYIGRAIVTSLPVPAYTFGLEYAPVIAGLKPLKYYLNLKDPEEMVLAVRWLNFLDKPVYGSKCTFRNGKKLGGIYPGTYCSLNDDQSRDLRNALNEVFALDDIRGLE